MKKIDVIILLFYIKVQNHHLDLQTLVPSGGVPESLVILIFLNSNDKNEMYKRMYDFMKNLFCKLTILIDFLVGLPLVDWQIKESI